MVLKSNLDQLPIGKKSRKLHKTSTFGQPKQDDS
jgi:hypothetical protein